jgi:hypothetical protein
MSTPNTIYYAGLPRAFVVVTVLVTLAGCDDGSTDGGDDGGPPGACEAPIGPGVEHSGAIASDETWAAADGPHVVTFGIDVAAGARLTIEPCSQVRLRQGYSVVVEGELVAEGTAERPIELVADDPTEPWGSIQVFAPGSARLAYVTLQDAGGDTSNAYGALEARGDQYLPAQEVLFVDHVTVVRSSAYGVSLRAGAAFTADSSDLIVTGSSKAPLRILPRLASNVPTGSYTGNAEDVIAIETEAYGDVTLEDVTLHDRGVPYRVGDEVTLGDFIVRGDTSPVALTIEPGTILQFKAGARLEIDNDSSGAALVARGTPDSPIVFTSAAATPAAGDWVGVVFGGTPDARSRLDSVEIRYAGGASMADSHHCEPDGAFSRDENAAVSIYGEPASEFITNATIADSGRLGVNLAYFGSFVDFEPTNEFVNVPGCDVTWPRDADGNCPASSPCR